MIAQYYVVNSMVTELHSTKIEAIREFLELFGSDLDGCHPDAADALYEYVENPGDYEDFITYFDEEFGEEMSECFDEAYDFYQTRIKTKVEYAK